MERTLTVENEKLAKLLADRDENVQEGRKLQKDVDKLQQKQRKIGYKLSRIKEQVVPMVEEHRKELGDYEDISKVELVDGVVTLTVTDLLEEAKDRIIKAKEEYAKSINPEVESGDGEGSGEGEETEEATEEEASV